MSVGGARLAAVLLAALGLAAGGTARAAPFDDAPAGLVEPVEATPFTQRFRVGGAEVVLTKAPGPDEPPRPARCRGGGVELQVLGTPSPAAEPWIARACERLEVDAPALYSEVFTDLPQRPDPRARAALGWLVLAWLALLVPALPRSPAPWGWAAVGAAARLTLPGPRVFMGEAYPYDRLLTWAGLREPNLRYGLGSSALADVLRPVFGATPDALHLANLALSVLVVPCAWGAARAWTGDRRVAHAAGALTALLPLPVALGATESMFVACSALAATAILGLTRDDRGLLTAVAAGLLAHTRPLQAGLAITLLLLLAARRRLPAAALGAALVGWRVVQLAGTPGDRPVPSASDLDRLARHLLGAGSPTVVLDPWVTPWWLVPLGLLGATHAWRRGSRRPVASLLLLAAAGTLPYLPFHRATDLLRFHLPVHTVWALLAALAAPALADAGLMQRAATAALLASGILLARSPLEGGFAHTAEHAALREALCALPAGTEVAYDPALDPHGARARWASVACDVKLLPVPEDGRLADGALVWRGLADRMPGARPPGGCARVALRTQETPPWTGRMVDLGSEPVVLALERVTCDTRASPP